MTDTPKRPSAYRTLKTFLEDLQSTIELLEKENRRVTDTRNMWSLHAFKHVQSYMKTAGWELEGHDAETTE